MNYGRFINVIFVTLHRRANTTRYITYLNQICIYNTSVYCIVINYDFVLVGHITSVRFPSGVNPRGFNLPLPGRKFLITYPYLITQIK